MAERSSAEKNLELEKRETERVVKEPKVVETINNNITTNNDTHNDGIF